MKLGKMLRYIKIMTLIVCGISNILSESSPETIEVNYPLVKPYGYGTLSGWYGNKKSEYLLDHPIKSQHEQMNRNYVKSGEEWAFFHFPEGEELPDLGDWWDWDVELQNIKDVVEDVGADLGKFETHFIAGTEVVDPLKWEKTDDPQRFEITNTDLKNEIKSKYSNDSALNFTQAEWDGFGITEIYAFSYVNIEGNYFKPVSPGNNRINDQVGNMIIRDSIDNYYPPYLKAEGCGGICYYYMTKNNRKRSYLVLNLGFWNGVNDHVLGISSEEEKLQEARMAVYSSIVHEYNHVVQMQSIDPFVPVRWNGEENGYGERSPNAISRWWLESFAASLPEALGYHHPHTLNAVRQSITDITSDSSLSEDEFADRMMYTEPYGYLTKFHWGSLAAAYMAKLTSWKYVLSDFYFDFQRVASDAEALNEHQNTIDLVPELDRIFQHNFGKTEEGFLKDLFRIVRSGELTFEMLFPKGRLDFDGDSVDDGGTDEFPFDASESLDTDKDGIGNNTDEDDDGDGYLDIAETVAGGDSLDAFDLAVTKDYFAGLGFSKTREVAAARTLGQQDVTANPETYELATMAQMSDAAEAARTIVNVSARVDLGEGEIVTPGFTVLGEKKKLLIRAVGPKLVDLGVPSPMQNPTMSIYKSRWDGNPPDLVATIDDWKADNGNVAEIVAAMSSAGAFPLEPTETFQGRPFMTDDTSSAAALVTLDIGVYTVQVSSADDGVGEVLVEVYEVTD